MKSFRTGKKIYVASRASIPERAQMWREMRANGANIVSSWIDESGVGETENYEELWSRILGEITTCARLVLYVEKEDFPLKGALIECGMALALDKEVHVVLNDVELEGITDRPLGSWIRHKNVKIVKSVWKSVEMDVILLKYLQGLDKL
jgi:hypothetical protein